MRKGLVALGLTVVVAFFGMPAATVGAAPRPLPAGPGRIVVRDAADAGPGSLRAAITNANTRPGADTIVLATSRPVQLRTALPAITDALTLDGAGHEIRGPGSGIGLFVKANDVSITRLKLRNFTNGIRVEKTSRVSVTKNEIRDNAGAGVVIAGPTKKEVAKLVAAKHLDLQLLMALVPTDDVVHDNQITANRGAAVVRTQEGAVHVAALSYDGTTIRGAVAQASGAATVDVYSSTACDAKRPQAERLLGTATVNAKGAFSLRRTGLPNALTAIVTDETSGSSGVSACARRVAAPKPPAPTTTTTTTVKPAAAVARPTPTTARPPAPIARLAAPQIDGRSRIAATFTPPDASACTTTFDQANLSNSWHDPLNWNPVGLPGSADIVCIPAGKSAVFSTGITSVAGIVADGSLTIIGGSLSDNGPSQIANLTLAGGELSGSGDVAVTNAFGWTTGTLDGSGSLQVESSATATLSSGGTKSLSRPLVNNGTVKWSGGQLQMRSDLGGVGDITNNKSFEITADDLLFWCCGSVRPTVTNAVSGTITRTALASASGTTGFEGVGLENHGTLALDAGTLRLSVAGAHTLAGTVSGGIGTTFLFASGVWDLTGTYLAGTTSVTGGTVNATASSSFTTNTLSLQAGTLDLSTPDAQTTIFAFNLVGGTLTGSTSVAPVSSMLWTSGALAGSGSFTIDDGLTATLSSGGTKSLSRPLVNNGTVKWSGGQLQMRSDLGGVGDITNNKSFEITADDLLFWCCGSVRPTVTNAVSGTITRTALASASGTTGFEGVGLENHGTLALDAGTLRLSVAGAHTLAGTVSGGIGTTFLFASGVWDLTGTYLAGTTSVTGGTVNATASSSFTTNTLSLQAGTLDLSTPDAQTTIFAFNLVGGTLTGSTSVAPVSSMLWTSGALAGSGSFTIDDGLTATLSSGGTKSLSRPLVNNGTVKWSGGQLQMRSDLGGVGDITNNKSFEITADDLLFWCCGSVRPTVTNAVSGTITRTALASASGTTGFEGVGLENHGTLALDAGTLRLSVAGAHTLAGTVSGGIGTTFLFASGVWDLTGTYLAGTTSVTGGTVNATASSSFTTNTLSLQAGTLDLSTPDAQTTIFAFNLVGGTLTGSTSVAPVSSMLWTSGALAGSGSFTIDDGLTATLSSGGTKSLSRPLVNNGLVRWSGGQLQMRSDLGGVGDITNNKSFEITADDLLFWCCGSVRPTVTNAVSGTITRTALASASGTTGFEGVGLENHGTLALDAGTLRLSVAGAHTLAGTVSGGIGTTFLFASGVWDLTGTYLAGTTSVTGGTVNATASSSFTTNTLSLQAGTLDLSTPDAQTTIFAFNLVGGTLTGSTSVAPVSSMLWTSGALAGSGSFTIDDGLTATLSSGGTKSLSRPLVNNGLVRWSGGQLQMRSDLGGVGSITNNKTFEITASDLIFWCCGPTRPFFKNNQTGHVTRSGAGTTDINGTSFENKGEVNVASGVFSLSSVQPLDLSGGTLTQGTWRVGAAATLKMQGANITRNDAHIALEGTDAELTNESGVNALRNLALNNGTLELVGGGELTTNGALDNHGTITLGGSDSLHVNGDYTQSSAARLDVAIAGSSIPGFDFSQLTATGTAHLDGTLGITTVAPFTPTNESFRVVDATTLDGTFAHLVGADLGGGAAYNSLYDAPGGNLDLVVTGVATLGFTGIVATTEFDGTVDVPFALDHAVGVPVHVFVTTESGTAIGDEDYATTGIATTIAAGQTTGSVEIPILDDALPERDETFTVVITGVDAGGVPVALADDHQVVTILDDDGPIPTVDVSNTAVSEGDLDLPVDVTLSAPIPVAVQVHFTTADGTATDGIDYDATTGTATIAAGQTTGEAVVHLREDTEIEPDETFTVHITGVDSGAAAVDIGTADGIVTIVNDDTAAPPQIVVVPQTVVESAGIFPITVSGIGGNAPADVPVTFTDGTAKAADYTGIAGVVTVQPNSTATVFVTIVDDLFDEDDETFTVSVGGVVATITIADNDPIPNAVIADADALEGNSGTTNATFTIGLVDQFGLPIVSGRDVLVQATTESGTATEGTDFEAVSTIVTIHAGAGFGTVSVPVKGDTNDEGGETFRVNLAPALNVQVAPNTFATGSIIDDDTPIGTGDVPSQLDQGTNALVAALPNWGGAFDLDDTTAFHTPVVTDQLASRLGLASALQNDFVDPVQNPGSDLGQLLDSLEAHGAHVDWVAGALGGRPAPPTAQDIVQIRTTTTLADLAEAAGFAADEYNDETSGVLQGIASAFGLDGTLTISGDMTVTLVFGVDDQGFYVGPGTALRLDVNAAGSVGGTGDMANAAGAAISGSGDAQLAVSLHTNTRLRVAQFSDDPRTLLHPTATGTAHLALTAAQDPLELAWSSAYTVTTDGTTTTVTNTASLDGSLTLPQFSATLHGTLNGSTWTLQGTAAGGTVDGVVLDSLVGNATITPTTFSGSLDAVAHVDLGNGGTPPSGSLHATFGGAALHATVHVGVSDQDFVAGVATLHLHNATLDVTLDADVDAQTATVAATVSADSVTGALHGVIEFDLEDLDLHLGSATGHLFDAGSVSATVPSLGDVTVALSDFHLNRNGTFGASEVDVTPNQLTQALGVAGILPIDLTGAQFTFPDDENLDQFTVDVDGKFDFAAMSVLPFTPEIGIGGPAITPSTPAAQNHFTISLAVDSLANGDIRPIEFGDITLGFADLEIGSVTIGGSITLGAYHGGVFQKNGAGSLTIGGDLDVIDGDATIAIAADIDDVHGRVDIDGAFIVSAMLGDVVEIDGAELDFSLAIAFANGFTITGPTLTGAHIDTFSAHFSDFMTLTANDLTVESFDPAPGTPLFEFGGTDLQHPGIGVEFDEGAAMLAGWGGGAGHFAIDSDFKPRLLPGFFLRVTVPDNEHLGLPAFLPVHITELAIRFPNVDLDHIASGGVTLDGLSNFAFRVSGGIEATDTWPISASVDGLEVDVAKIVHPGTGFPITNIDSFKLGVEPFELVPGFKVGGGLKFGRVDVDADPGDGTQIQHVFYGQIFGTFEYEGIGAGINLVVSQYGPVLAQLTVPVGIPIDGGLLGGVILSDVTGGVKFGGPAFPDPQRPLEILHDPAFDTDFPINDGTIHDAVQGAVQRHSFTWTDGFTLALSGTIIHALAPGIVTGEVTLGVNVGLIPGQQGLKLIGSGTVNVFGMAFAGAAELIDLTDPLAPRWDIAFETPQVGNPLSFLLPAQAQFEATLDTKGIVAGFGLGVRAFVERVVSGGIGVGQGLFDAALDQLATELDHDRGRPLAQLLFPGSTAPITRQALINAVLAHIALAGNGLPADPQGALDTARTFVQEMLDVAGRIADDFDLSGVNSDPKDQTFANALGAGGEAIAAMLGVLRDAVQDAGQAFLAQFDPSFHLKGLIQPVILGIPFGKPKHSVELTISKQGIGFGFETSLTDISQQLSNLIFPVVAGAILSTMQLGFSDDLALTFELPLGGFVDGLFGGSGVPTIDPLNGDWEIGLSAGLKFMGFDIAQMSGLIVAPHNQGFVDTHVQKLYEPHQSVDATRIPIQSAAHYQALIDDGGILLTGRLLLPKLLTDPAGLLASLNLTFPANPLDIPAWVSAISGHLSETTQPALMQVFVPGFGAIIDPDFDAPTEIQRLGFSLSGPALADAVNAIFEDAYIEGTVDGTLLGMQMSESSVSVQGGKVAIKGKIPLIGLTGTFLLDTHNTPGSGGVNVPLPRAATEVDIDPTLVNGILAQFNLPPLVSPLAGTHATFRAYTPGYDTASSDPLLRHGGIEIVDHLRIAGVVNDAEFHLGIAGDGVHADASVASFTPIPGLVITKGHVGFSVTSAGFAGALSGTAALPPWLATLTGIASVAVNGSFDSSGAIHATVTINGKVYDLVSLFTASVDRIVDILREQGANFIQVADMLFRFVTTNVTTIVDQLVRVGANFIQLAEALFQKVTTNVTTIVDQLVRKGASFIQLAEALFQKVTTNVTTIVDQLVRKGASFIQLAEALFTKVTTNVTTIVDQLVRKGANFIQLAEALFTKVTTDVTIIVDQLVRKGANFIQLAEALFTKVTTNVTTIVDQLVRKGANFIQLAEALFQKVTTNVTTIVDQLVRKGATFIQLAEALFQKVTTNVTTIVDQLVRKGANFIQLAEALFQKVTTNVTTIVDQLVRKGATFIQLAEALFTKVTTNVTTIVDQLVRKGATFIQLAEALFTKVTTNVTTIVDQLVRKGATFIQLAEALFTKVTTNVTTIVDQLVRKGATFIQLAEALFQKVTTNVTTIVDQLVRKNATFIQLAEALFTKVTTNVTIIVDQLVRKGATHLQLAEALFTKVTTNVSTIVDQVFRKFADFSKVAEALFTEVTTSTQTIVDQLERKGASINQISAALAFIGKSFRQIAAALDDFTSASFNSIADALRASGASFRNIVDALDASTNAGLNSIADAVRHAGASFTQVMSALENELNVDRFDTAGQLSRLGASVNQIMDALVSVYNAGLQSIIDVLVQVVGLSVAAATNAACHFLNLC